MTTRKQQETDLSKRIVQLDATEELLSAITGIPLQRVTEMVLGAGEPITPDEKVRLRVLKNELAAREAIHRERTKRTQTLQSEQERRDEQMGHIYAGGYHAQSVTVPK